MADTRERIYRLRRRLQCEECDAAAVLAAAEQSGNAAALKAIAGDYDADGTERAGTLTTVVIDEVGDYILENARSHEGGDRDRLRTRPARITFLVHGRGAAGEPKALAIPAEMGFGNDDDAITNWDWMRPLIAAGVTDTEQVLEIMRYAVFRAEDPNDTSESTAFEATARERIAEAMQPEAPERLVIEIEGRVVSNDESHTEANVQARTAAHEGGIVRSMTTAGKTADAAAERAVGGAISATMDAVDAKAARAESLDTTTDDSSDDDGS